MSMRDDFCVFILSHARADRVFTYKTLEKCGYTGKVYIVIDDEDDSADEYRKRYGDRVLQFCKRDVAKTTDDGDNFGHRRSVIYARNVCWDLAKQVGCKYFIQLDDDYTYVGVRFGKNRIVTQREVHSADQLFDSVIQFVERTGFATVALAQGGDYIGGPSQIRLKRKAMNSFVCSTDRPISFIGRINEDVTTYVTEGRRGKLFGTTTSAYVIQQQTQANAGGWTEYYLEVGTYVKSFYSVMYAPSCVQIGTLGDPRSPHYRIHHKINWHKAVPKIIRQDFKK
jgi:hypothetical protein